MGEEGGALISWGKMIAVGTATVSAVWAAGPSVMEGIASIPSIESIGPFIGSTITAIGSTLSEAGVSISNALGVTGSAALGTFATSTIKDISRGH